MKKHEIRQIDRWKDENGIKIKGMTVKVKGTDINGAISTLKKRMLEEGIAKELRTREYYESKGQKRRRLKQEARRRHLREKKLLEQQELGEIDVSSRRS